MPHPGNANDHEELSYREDPLQQKQMNDMRLPGQDEELFIEEQPFDQAWIWALLGIQLAVVFLPMIFSGAPVWSFLLLALVMVSSLSMLALMKLHTRIDDEGVHYQLKPFHRKERMISWNEIDSIRVRKYSPLGEYGGWGIRGFPGNMAFNVKGNMGIQIVKKDGKKILLGTQKAGEAEAVLERRPMTV